MQGTVFLLFPLPTSHFCVGVLGVSRLGINYPCSYWLLNCKYLPVCVCVCVCVCVWTHVPSMSVALSVFLCSFPRLPREQRMEWHVLDQPRPSPGGGWATYRRPALATPPILTRAVDEIKAEEGWFDYLPDLCQCRKVCRRTCFPPVPVGTFLNVSPMEPSCGSVESGLDVVPSPALRPPTPPHPLYLASCSLQITLLTVISCPE